MILIPPNLQILQECLEAARSSVEETVLISLILLRQIKPGSAWIDRECRDTLHAKLSARINYLYKTFGLIYEKIPNLSVMDMVI